MKKNEIKAILIERGYNEKHATLAASGLEKVDANLVEPLRLWLKDETMTDVEYKGLTLIRLMQTYQMTYPAALLSMDWVYKEPEKALEKLSSAIQH